MITEDSVLISDPLHIYYLTGFRAALKHESEIGTRQNPMFLGISKNGSMFLLAARSSLSNPIATEDAVFDARGLFEGRLWIYGDYEIDERVSATMDFVAEELSEVTGEMKSKEGFDVGRVGIEEWHVPYEVTSRLSKEFPAISFGGISNKIIEMRMGKDESERGAVAAAAQRLRIVFEQSVSLLVPGETELDAMARMKGAMRERFGDDALLSGQVLSGNRTSHVFGNPSSKKLVRGEPAILDLVTEADGYYAREAITIRIGSDQVQGSQTSDKLSQALEEGQKLLRPGAAAGDVFNAVSKSVDVGSDMAHEAGHGLGLEPREGPFLIPYSTLKIVPGMTCVLMAGSYSGSEGYRLSRCYSVGMSGAVRL